MGLKLVSVKYLHNEKDDNGDPRRNMNTAQMLQASNVTSFVAYTTISITALIFSLSILSTLNSYRRHPSKGAYVTLKSFKTSEISYFDHSNVYY